MKDYVNIIILKWNLSYKHHNTEMKSKLHEIIQTIAKMKLYKQSMNKAILITKKGKWKRLYENIKLWLVGGPPSKQSHSSLNATEALS